MKFILEFQILKISIMAILCIIVLSINYGLKRVFDIRYSEN